MGHHYILKNIILNKLYMAMCKKCSLCFNEITNIDIVNNKCHHIGTNVFCEKCFNDIEEDDVFFCERCCEFDYKNDNYIETEDINNDIIYYHNKCLFETEKCFICKKYLKNEECVFIFVNYNCKMECHEGCVDDKYDIEYWKTSLICKYCGISFRVKCTNCSDRFRDCYNKDCENYDEEAEGDNGEPGRYNGRCRYCNSYLFTFTTK